MITKGIAKLNTGGRPSYLQRAFEQVYAAREGLGEVRASGTRQMALSAVYDALDAAMTALLLASDTAARR
jgi:hypothetical protein